MKPVDADEFWRATIDWMRPIAYDTAFSHGTPSDDDAHLYLISGRYSRFRPKVLYIGKTYSQYIGVRLRQRDHRRRLSEWQDAYPRHRFWVSAGIVSIENGRMTRNRLDALERILIYSSVDQHTRNVQNLYSHGVTGSYEIVNRGSRCGLSRVIALGMFSS